MAEEIRVEALHQDGVPREPFYRFLIRVDHTHCECLASNCSHFPQVA